MTENIYPDKNDTSNYICKVYYESGALKHVTQISDNKFIGEKRTYFENGKVEQIEILSGPTALDDGYYDCNIIAFRPDGTKESHYQYIDNKIHGLVTYFDSSGKMEGNEEYAEDKLNGLRVFYHPNGRVKLLSHCINDSVDGYEYEFNDAGDTLKANIYYGKSDKGVFYKKWLSDGRLLTGSYGDSNRTFVIWKWYDRQRAFLKSVTDKGRTIGSSKNRFIAPE